MNRGERIKLGMDSVRKHGGRDVLIAREMVYAYDDALIRAGAFVTPDQPAAPDEDVIPHVSGTVVQEGTIDWTDAPDEDAAVRDGAEQMWAIMCPGDSLNPHGIDWARNAIAAGYTRRPVDTRPTTDQIEALFYSDCVYSPTEISYKLYCADLATESPDPAPAAEVPVVEVPADKLRFAVNQLRQLSRSQNGLMYTDFLADDLEAALTKATDR